MPAPDSSRVSIRVGTRGSTLARTQTAAVIAALRDAHGSAVEFTEVVITTSGDRASRSDRTGATDGGEGGAADGRGGGKSGGGDAGATADKSRFVAELEVALAGGEIDLAVHSAKDLPGDLHPGLMVAAVPHRAAPHDVLCGAGSLADLPPGARVGTSSPRRRAQLLAERPDLTVEALSGNVDTRLAKLAGGEWDAIVLARAGLDRLGRGDEIGCALSDLIPAAGQGCLAIEARSGDAAVAAIVAPINDPASAACLAAERAATQAFGADCHTPVGAHATLTGDTIELRVWCGLADGSEWVTDRQAGDIGSGATDAVDGDETFATAARALGRAVAERILLAGGRSILERMRQETAA